MSETTVNVSRVALDAEDQRRLKKMNDDMIGVRQFVATVQEQGEARLSQLQATMRDTWAAVAQKYGLDLESVSYELSNDGTELVPTRVKVNV